eukprot:scaffold10476_cov44-Cyclotella_meneghiniana.AAC.2
MAEQIAERLLRALNTGNDDDTGNSIAENIKQWSDDIEKDLLSATTVPKKSKEDPSISSTSLMVDAASKLHRSLLLAVNPSVVCQDDWSSDEEAREASLNAANSLSASKESDRDAQYFTLVAELLRAAGLFMRWYQTLQFTAGSNTKNPTTRLKSEGMLLICMKLLELDLPLDSPDVPRFASIYLFRATYGNDAVTVTARKTFVDSLNGCVCLMEALLKGNQTLSRVFSLVRNVHHLISAHPSSITKMDKAVATLTVDTPKENDAKHDLLEVLVVTMSWTFKSEPAFPGDSSDRRSDLILEILRALFALDAGVTSKSQYSENTMTQIGILLCELLKLSNADARVYQCKLATVALLLNAPKEYAGYLFENGGIKPLIDIMKYQLSIVVVERTGSGAEDAAAVVPILLVLNNLSQANATVLRVVKDAVFPPEAEIMFQEKVKAEMVNPNSGQVKAKNMAPLDAPKGSLRWKLIRLMTWTDSSVKRSGCELLWTLCDDDPTQFVLRTGFGNAVHFLGIKGCVALPAGVETREVHNRYLK